MPIDLTKLGTSSSTKVAVLDPDRARAYAAATNDANPAYVDGTFAPPVFAVVPAFEALGEAIGTFVPAEGLLGLVHGEQDIHFHRPLVPGMTLHTVASPFSVRVSGSGTRVTSLAKSTDESGDPVVDQYFTVFLRGYDGGGSGGPDKPGHDFPEEARGGAPAGSYTIHVDDDQTFRYRDASGDTNPIHVDEEFARNVGLPGIIVHGLCTMAMTSQAVLQAVGGGDPSRLRRLAVRFAANVLPGNDLETTIYDAGEVGGRRRYAFESVSDGAVVIKNGLAEMDA